jgi:leader peptidase (prepilin peptidase)/N-methyltransferase
MPPTLTRTADEIAPHRRAVSWSLVPAAAWAVWVSGPGWTTPAVVVAAAAGAALWVVDVRTHRLPDAITSPATALVVALLAVAALTTADGAALVRALVGAAALGGLYLLLHLVHRAGLGLGDVKLAPLVGLLTAWAGWSTWLAALVLPFVVGGVVALGLVSARRATRSTALAFGPFMLAGAALALTAARLAA